MESLGIDVVLHDPRSIDGAFADTFKIGTIVGRKHYARDLLQSMRKQVAAASKGIEKHPKVMLILGVGRTPFTFLPNSWGGDIVTKAGGELLTGGVSSSSGFERISDEVVVAENPDMIIAVPHANADDIPSLTEYLRDEPRLVEHHGGAERPGLRLGRQLAAAGRHRHRPHDPQGPPRLPEELSPVGAPDPGLRGAAGRARRSPTVASLALRRGQGARSREVIDILLGKGGGGDRPADRRERCGCRARSRR